MATLRGIKALHPSALDSKPHVLGFSTARSTTADTLLELWNGSTNAALVWKADFEGRTLGGNGTVGAPAFSFEGDSDSGMYRIGANNVGLAVNGAKVLDVGTAGLSVTGTLTASGAATLSGVVGVGASPANHIGLYVQSSSLTAASSTSIGLASAATFTSAATSWGRAVNARVFTAASSFTMAEAAGLYVADASRGSGSTITTLYGLYVEAQTAGGTNYAIYTNAGAVRLGGAVTMASTLAVTGAATFSSTINGQTISATASLTGTLAVTGAVTLTVALATGSGGTGLASYTAGDLVYYASGTALSKLGIGTARQLLQTNAGATAPEWASNIDVPGTLDVTSTATFDAGIVIAADQLINAANTGTAEPVISFQETATVVNADPTTEAPDGWMEVTASTQTRYIPFYVSV